MDIVSVSEMAAYIAKRECVINLLLKALHCTLLCKNFLNCEGLTT